MACLLCFQIMTLTFEMPLFTQPYSLSVGGPWSSYAMKLVECPIVGGQELNRVISQTPK